MAGTNPAILLPEMRRGGSVSLFVWYACGEIPAGFFIFHTGGMTMSKIDIQHVTFTYDGGYQPVFQDVSFQLDTDWKLGLIGRNGRGKTTLLRLLMGEEEYRGRITAGVDFAYFPYKVADPEQNTLAVIENICPGHDDWEFYRELNLLETDPEVLFRPFSSLSPGEQTKVLLAALFCRDNAFLLIDEPTNHLDIHARQAVGRYLCRKKGFILVSHDRDLLDQCVDHILAINKAGIDVQRGNFSSWMVNKQRQDQYEEMEQERLRRDIRRLESAARRTADWSDQAEKSKKGTRNAGLRPDRGYIGHKAANMMKRSQAIDARRQTAIQETKQLLRNVESTDVLNMQPLPIRAGRLLELIGVTITIQGRELCHDLSFALEAGDRVALCGPNGCGKSTLLRLIGGQELSHSGQIMRMSGLKISYIPQSTADLRGTPIDYARMYGIDEQRFKAALSKMEMQPATFHQDMATLSEGQKKKILLARSLCEQAHLYIWDEPFNFLDVLSRVQIEQMLLNCQPTLLFVEHDEAFCRHIAARTVMIGTAGRSKWDVVE